MSKVFSAGIQFFRGGSSIDSFADRLNCRITVCILLVVAVLAMVRVLISEPIRCFSPSQFTTEQAAFAKQSCWMSATYYQPVNELPPGEEVLTTNNPSAAYYRWIPVILAFQAFLFYLPKLFWNLTSSISGSINIRHIASSEIQRQQNSSDPDGAAQNMQYMTKCLGRNLVEFDIRWKLATTGERCWLLLSGNCAFIFYIAVKLLYVLNCLLQLIRINVLLGGGLGVLGRLSSGALEEPEETKYLLPRSILCKLKIMQLSRVHSYTFYCSLSLNFWYEIVFLFLWTWLIFVFSASIWSLIRFVISMLNFFYQERYCRLRLLAMAKANEAQSNQVSQFVQNFLTRDAWFIVQKVGTISGDQKATELVCGLWENYIANKQQTDGANLPLS